MLRDRQITLPQRRQLEAVSGAGDQLLHLIDSILQIAKIEAGRVSIEETTFDAQDLLHELERLFLARASMKGLSFLVEWDGTASCPTVADDAKLRQVLSNLISNALKFTQSGGVTLRGSVLNEGLAARLTFEVEDTGPGIAGEELSRLFHKFEQTDTGRRSGGGTGLGLAISRELARHMGGDITVRSVVGVGTTFLVEIPWRRGDSSRLPHRREIRRVQRLRKAAGSLRVLIVDDEERNRALLAALLQAVGFVTREVADGERAISAFASWAPHLILMDMRMPGLDGAAAIAGIRALPAGASVKIVSVTASAFEEDRRVARAAGADEFVSKPFREVDLLEKMGALLGVEYDHEHDLRNTPVGPAIPTKAAVASLPETLRSRLWHATESADLEVILALLEPSEAHLDADLAQQLRLLAENFAYTTLLELLS